MTRTKEKDEKTIASDWEKPEIVSRTLGMVAYVPGKRLACSAYPLGPTSIPYTEALVWANLAAYTGDD